MTDTFTPSFGEFLMLRELSMKAWLSFLRWLSFPD